MVKKVENRVLGVDPGVKGGLVVISEGASLLHVAKMPLVSVRRNGKWKDVISPEGIADFMLDTMPTHVFIEQVFSSPQMGVTSAFTFGEGKGYLLGACAALKLPVVEVSPQKWKGDLHLSADKREAKALARRCFTNSKLLRTEGQCEAALIAMWGWAHTGL